VRHYRRWSNKYTTRTQRISTFCVNAVSRLQCQTRTACSARIDVTKILPRQRQVNFSVPSWQSFLRDKMNTIPQLLATAFTVLGVAACFDNAQWSAAACLGVAVYWALETLKNK